MSEKELNSYRLTSLEEPSDEMLAQIMHEIAVEVKARNEATERKYMSEMLDRIQRNKASRTHAS